MKIFFTSMALMIHTVATFGATTAEINKERLKVMLQYKTQDVWSCSAGTQDVMMLFRIHDKVGGLVSSNEVLVVQEPTICAALHVICPYVGGAWGEGHTYYSSLGKYEDSLSFTSDGAGMKLESYFGRSSWYFNPGECVKLDAP